MRLTISREPPMRAAISLCVSRSAITRSPFALHRVILDEAHEAAVDVLQREVAHLGRERAHLRDHLLEQVAAKPGVREQQPFDVALWNR